MMGETVEQRPGQALRAERLGPFVEGKIRGDADRRALVGVITRFVRRITLRARNSSSPPSTHRLCDSVSRWPAYPELFGGLTRWQSSLDEFLSGSRPGVRPRFSEVAALDCADLATETDGSGRLTIRHSKTDQKGEGAVQFIGSPTVRRVQAWLDAAGHRAGPMFRRVRRGSVMGNERIADRSLRRIIARRAAGGRSRPRGGVDGDKVGEHGAGVYADFSGS